MKIPAMIAACVLSGAAVWAAVGDAPPAAQEAAAEPDRLGVLWTSGDRDVALKMVFMYTGAAQRGGWWDEIRFIVWGPSAKLLSEDQELQGAIQRMAEAGVELLACKACADQYGVSGDLEELGIEVKYMGRPLTTMLKGDWTVLTF